MLHDDRRTGDYLAALAPRCGPDDVVLDIGTGSGVLAVAAARAGARRVYAVEASDIAAVAAAGVRGQRRTGPRDAPPRMVEADRAAGAGRPAGRRGHRQRAVRGRDPRDHARCPSPSPQAGRPLDSACAHAVRPVRSCCPRPRSGNASFGRAAVERWRDLYGIDFEPLLDAAFPGPIHTITEGEVVATWPQVGPAGRARLGRPHHLRGAVAARVAPTSSSTHRARSTPCALTFRAHLHDGISHTLDPGRGRPRAGQPRCGCSPTRSRSAPGSVYGGYHRRVAGTTRRAHL